MRSAQSIPKNVEKDLDNDEDNYPLVWKVKKPVALPTPTLVRGQVGITKGKER